MTRDQKIIIPCVQLGNIILLPQPSRGWGDDPMKLYHSPLVWPHHQYTAAYLWLKKKFHADAVIHLGRHGTHEWLPGKEAGLSPSCPPEVLIQDLPNIYPYIVDGIGEGLQAKRRGTRRHHRPSDPGLQEKRHSYGIPKTGRSHRRLSCRPEPG